jgi:hypothetical protein
MADAFPPDHPIRRTFLAHPLVTDVTGEEEKPSEKPRRDTPQGRRRRAR